MPVTDIKTDRGALTMTITAHYGTSIERVWNMWADPRMLEKWWGPPIYPATVTEHDLTPGGTVRYYMTGPDGDTPGGWWLVKLVEPPHRLEFEDGFTDADGNPDDGMPRTTSTVILDQDGDEVRMKIVSTFSSIEALEELVAMGMEEGIRQAVGQIDALLE